MSLRNGSPGAIKRARRLRKTSSESEDRLWQALRRDQIGFSVRRQVPVGPYTLDFFIHEAMLCIEVDGEQHVTRKEADDERDRYLALLGIETMRVPSWELFGSLDAWVSTIYERCVQRKGQNDPEPPPPGLRPPSPRQRWRGRN